jgi:hypothetical protein
MAATSVVGQLLQQIGDLEAERDELREALEHYAAEEAWSEESGDVYTTWGYDGGQGEPWTVARKALERPELVKEDADA